MFIWYMVATAGFATAEFPPKGSNILVYWFHKVFSLHVWYKVVFWHCCSKLYFSSNIEFWLVLWDKGIGRLKNTKYDPLFLFADEIRPLDVGLDNEAQIARNWSSSTRPSNGRRGRNGANQFAAPIKYLHIHECESFSVRSLIDSLFISMFLLCGFQEHRKWSVVLTAFRIY